VISEVGGDKMDSSLIAKELLAISDLVSSVSGGLFSKRTNFVVHSFEEKDYLLQALKRGSFGRARFTSLGNEESSIKKQYRNQIWFKTPSNAEPVFYINEDVLNTSKDIELQKEYGSINNGTQYGWHIKEQEWFVRGVVSVSSIDIELVVYDGEKDSEIRGFVGKDVSIMSYDEFRSKGLRV